MNIKVAIPEKGGFVQEKFKHKYDDSELSPQRLSSPQSRGSICMMSKSQEWNRRISIQLNDLDKQMDYKRNPQILKQKLNKVIDNLNFKRDNVLLGNNSRISVSVSGEQ